jgi:cysteinyl-tRNA synthetase
VEKAGGKRDVYYSVRSFAGNGKLSRRKLDDLTSGARVETDEDKRDPLDFALWKGAATDEWGWQSPWGHGRPGWHIECSAMSSKFLGHGFDIHGGGMDLIFPHHENEIAQSEAAHPGQGDFARFWLHNGFVNIDKEKMSKSLGNFVTIRDVLARNDPEAFRWFLIAVQYRGPIQFDTEQVGGRVVFPGIEEAERRVDYMYSTLGRLRDVSSAGITAPAKLPADLSSMKKAVDNALKAARAALCDDLNTPVALAELGEIAKLANELGDLVKKRRKDVGFVGAAGVVAKAAELAILEIAAMVGVLQTPRESYSARSQARRLSVRSLDASTIERKVAERVQARKDKDFARSDALRDELAGLGISLRDAPDGTTSWTVEA